MSIGKKLRLKGKSIQLDEFGHIPSAMEAPKLEALVIKWRNKTATKDEIDELLFSHLRLIISIVSYYASRSSHLTFDLISEAVLAVVDLLSKPERMYDNNITPYIATTVRGCLHNYILDQQIVPHSTFTLKKAKSEKIPIYQSLEGEHGYYSDARVFEIMELIDYCIKKDDNLVRAEYKSAIIRLKASGYNNTEVANILEISESQVRLLITEVKTIYEEHESR